MKRAVFWVKSMRSLCLRPLPSSGTNGQAIVSQDQTHSQVSSQRGDHVTLSIKVKLRGLQLHLRALAAYYLPFITML